MPWKVSKSASCPASKPYAVIKKTDGSVVACHATHESAAKQVAALYANYSGGEASMSTTEDETRRTFTADERKNAAKKGAAMPGGKFPILNEQDLKNAIRLAGHASDPAAARAHIKKRARALGLTALLPDDWRSDEADPPRDSLVRAVMDDAVEFRDATDERDGRLGTLHGHFAKFNQWTKIDSAHEGRFMEQVAPGAFAKTFSESRSGMRVLFNHGKHPHVGEMPLGPISELREDSVGAYYEVPLLDTSYNRDLLPGLEAGLFGASFRFKVMRDDLQRRAPTSDWNPDGLPQRTIQEASVREFGPVTFPAYEGATAGVRSMTDEFFLASTSSSMERFRDYVAWLEQVRDSLTLEPSDTDGYTDPDSTEPNAPPETRRPKTPPASGRRGTAYAPATTWPPARRDQRRIPTSWDA
jgi:HK97 family phage prohead protease